MDNPFKLIKPTDQPPENLKKDVLDSVELMMLVIRLMQLFMVDYSMSIPESLEHLFKADKHVNKPDADGPADAAENQNPEKI